MSTHQGIGCRGTASVVITYRDFNFHFPRSRVIDPGRVSHFSKVTKPGFPNLIYPLPQLCIAFFPLHNSKIITIKTSSTRSQARPHHQLPPTLHHSPCLLANAKLLRPKTSRQTDHQNPRVSLPHHIAPNWLHPSLNHLLLLRTMPMTDCRSRTLQPMMSLNLPRRTLHKVTMSQNSSFMATWKGRSLA